MKIKTKDLTNEHQILSHLVTSCLNEEANNIISSIEDRNGETEYDVKLIFEGVELDITRFSKKLDKQFDEIVKTSATPLANEIFEKWKHSFKSKNSKAMKLQKIIEQFDKINNQLLNIKQSIETINID